MAKFSKNVAIAQADPTIQVEVSVAAPLPLGLNRFQLVVIDQSGNASAPATIDVIVKDTDKPTAVIDMVNADGAIITPPEARDPELLRKLDAVAGRLLGSVR